MIDVWVYLSCVNDSTCDDDDDYVFVVFFVVYVTEKNLDLLVSGMFIVDFWIIFQSDYDNTCRMLHSVVSVISDSGSDRVRACVFSIFSYETSLLQC